MWEFHETARRSDGSVLTSIVRRPDLYFSMSCSAVDEAALLVKNVIDPTTGRHLAFVCTACCLPFLHPTAATDDWLASMATMNRDDQRAHFVGAELLKSKNKRAGHVRPSGVTLGLCNRCYQRDRRGNGRSQRARSDDCCSTRHASGTPTPALFAPAPGILPWLWGPDKAEAQMALLMAEREKVCASCRTSSERASRAAKKVRPASSGLDVLAAVAANQPAVPLEVQLMGILERYDTSTPPELVCFEKLLEAHLRATKPTEISFVFKNGVKRRYILAPSARQAVVGPRQLRRRAKHASDALSILEERGGPSYQKELKALLSLAQRGEAVSVVPTHGRMRLPSNAGATDDERAAERRPVDQIAARSQRQGHRPAEPRAAAGRAEGRDGAAGEARGGH